MFPFKIFNNRYTIYETVDIFQALLKNVYPYCITHPGGGVLATIIKLQSFILRYRLRRAAAQLVGEGTVYSAWARPSSYQLFVLQRPAAASSAHSLLS